ncbi:MAG: MATE family efflux transporter, partial [Clostridia bacterium]|nr:MATE family efflux transporter [Clostridia bacterium]
TFVNQMYQCLGFTAVATLLASCRQGIFFIPYILIMPSVIGIAAIETVQPATDLLTFLVSIPFHIWFFKKVLGPNQK